ncbi:tetratricopeptide repeat protein [Parablastomonas sp. CN1-191]|uniref:tetratricopeptide repeat protein n=1 Tax=Parablastomonas sp. CN1-191 TaxID=3400908 RepID=UPI003BF857F3
MLRNGIIAALTLVLAVLAGSDALGRAAGWRLPALAEAMPLANGFDHSNMADVVLAPGLQTDVTAPLKLTGAAKQRVESLSKAGYAAEPLNSEALRNMALIAQSRGEAVRARALMQAAGQLTKRDLAVNLWLANDYARADKVDDALAMYDQALRTSSQAQSLILPSVIQALRGDTLVDPVIRLLSRRPPWLDEFWATAPRFPDSLGNLGRIRMALAQRGIGIAPNLDRELVEALAATGHFDTASALVHRLAPGARGAEAVTDPGFDHPIGFAPFDWAPLFDESLTTDLDQRAGTLRISTIGEGSGEAAHQLVDLPVPAYRLSVRVADWDDAKRGRIFLRLRCAQAANPAESAQIPVESPQFAVRVAKPSPGCRYNWLSIYAAVPSDHADSAVTLDRVSLVPAP